MGYLANEVFLYRRVGGKIWVYHFGKDEIVVKEYEEGVKIEKPTFYAEPETFRAIVSAFAKQAKAEGIEIESESTAKGKLEATLSHLADLRQLLKLK